MPRPVVRSAFRLGRFRFLGRPRMGWRRPSGERSPIQDGVPRTRWVTLEGRLESTPGWERGQERSRGCRSSASRAVGYGIDTFDGREIHGGPRDGLIAKIGLVRAPQRNRERDDGRDRGRGTRCEALSARTLDANLPCSGFVDCGHQLSERFGDEQQQPVLSPLTTARAARGRLDTGDFHIDPHFERRPL